MALIQVSLQAIAPFANLKPKKPDLRFSGIYSPDIVDALEGKWGT
jgi:hypothetical protein